MKHINKIYQAILNRNDKVVHKSEIISIIKEYNETFGTSLNLKNTIKYFSRHKYIKRIFQSYYYINSLDERKLNYCYYEDKELLFIVLSKLNIKWYIGLNSALYLSGENWQVPMVFNIINNKFSGEKRILSLKINFFKIKDQLIIGLIQKNTSKNKIKLFYSNISKTHIDMFYLRKTDKLNIHNKNKKYLKYYPKWVSKK